MENGREEDCHEGERERQPRETKDNACVCVVFVTVAFWRTEGLCACVCLCIYVCAFFASPSTQFVELIRSLIVSKTKRQPNPAIFCNTDGDRRGPER